MILCLSRFSQEQCQTLPTPMMLTLETTKGRLVLKMKLQLKVNMSATVLFCQVVLKVSLNLSLITTLTGGLGKNVALSNTAHIDVTGTNADTGLIGAKNSYDVTGELFLILLGPCEQFISD